MLGKRSEQKGLWEADRLYLDYDGCSEFQHLSGSRQIPLGVSQFSHPGIASRSARAFLWPYWTCTVINGDRRATRP